MMGGGVSFTEKDGSIIFGTDALPHSSASSIVSPRQYNDGRWHHIIATREQATGEYWLIVDGEEVRQSLSVAVGCEKSPPQRVLAGGSSHIEYGITHIFNRRLDINPDRRS